MGSLAPATHSQPAVLQLDETPEDPLVSETGEGTTGSSVSSIASEKQATQRMTTKECLSCQPGDATLHASAVANTGCDGAYKRVDDCMKKHNGRVSACTEEWALFRKCHEQSKALRVEQKKQASATSQ